MEMMNDERRVVGVTTDEHRLVGITTDARKLVGVTPDERKLVVMMHFITGIRGILRPYNNDWWC